MRGSEDTASKSRRAGGRRKLGTEGEGERAGSARASNGRVVDRQRGWLNGELRGSRRSPALEMQRGLATSRRAAHRRALGRLQGGPGSAQGALDDAKRRFDGGGRRVSDAGRGAGYELRAESW